MSTTIVNVGEAKTQLSRLIALAESGETVIVARDGVPVIRFALVEARRRRFGFRHLAIDDDAFFAPLSDDELVLWEGGA